MANIIKITPSISKTDFQFSNRPTRYHKWSSIVIPTILIGWLCGGFLHFSVAQQPATASLSTTEIFIQTLLNQETPQDLRELHARSLLRDTKAHQALIDKVLTSKGNLSAKIIVCRMIAKGHLWQPGPGFSKSAQVPHTFCEPLFGVLFEGDPELTRWAGPALVQCRDGVAKKLSEIIADPQSPAAQRIAGISALKLIPGKSSALTLASLLSEPQGEIRQHAITAISQMLYFSSPIDVHEFNSTYLPEIQQVDEVTFLQWLNRRQQLKLDQANSQMTILRQQTELLKNRIIKIEEEKFVLASSSDEKLQLLANNLKKEQEEFLRQWTMNQVILWSNTTALRSVELTTQVIGLVKGHIADSNPKVRQATAEVLGNLNPEAVRTASAQLLLAQLGNEKDMPATAAQLATLGKIGYEKALDPALKLWENSQDLQVASAAVGFLGRIVSTTETKTFQRVVNSLAGKLDRWNNSTEVRIAIIKSIKKMADLPNSQNLLWEKFSEFLSGSLADKNATLRSQAVEAFAQLRQSEALPVFLNSTNNMLNDSDSSVRFAVINAIKAFGGKNQLELLRQRRLKELKTKNFDVAGLLEGVMQSILKSLPTEAVYNWSVGLGKTDENEKILFQQAATILWKKIVQADTDGTKIPITYRILALDGQAKTSQNNKLYGEAIKWYSMLLDLKLPDNTKTNYQKAILDIILANDSVELLTAAKPALIPLLNSSPNAISQIAELSDTFDLKEDQQLNRSINVMMTLIVPLKDYPDANQKKAWQKRRCELALAILQRQTKLLTEKNLVKKEAIETIIALAPKLTAYPYQATPEQKKATLESYRATLLGGLVQQPKPKKPTTPKK